MGVGREFRDGGFTVADRFNEQPGGEDTSLLVDYDERDVDSVNLWYVWKFDSPRERVLDGPAPIRDVTTERNATPEGPAEEPELEREDFDVDWKEVGIGLLFGAVSLFGGQRLRTKIIERRKAKSDEQ